MTPDNWIAIVAIIVTISGGLSALIRRSLMGEFRNMLDEYGRKVNEDRINELRRENERLQERNENLKDQVRKTK